ncbi:MAG: Hsp20/alpha crystallin family protein [Nibricoccus sp.]
MIPSFARTPARSDEGKPSTPAVKPVYDIKETPEAYGVTVQLPGVSKEGLSITAEESTLIIRGERSWKRPTGWTSLYRESSDLAYELVLEHDNSVDIEKVHAELRDGVLRVSLPKTEARKPRKIAVS